MTRRCGVWRTTWRIWVIRCTRTWWHLHRGAVYSASPIAVLIVCFCMRVPVCVRVLLLHRYEHIRNSLRYGNEKLRLAGSAGRDPKLDLLHFGGVLADGTVLHGLDPRMVSFERHVSSIIHRFSRTPREAPLGANYSAIMGDEDLGDIQVAMGGEFNFLLEASIDEYRAQAADKMDSVSSFGKLLEAIAEVMVAHHESDCVWQTLSPISATRWWSSCCTCLC